MQIRQKKKKDLWQCEETRVHSWAWESEKNLFVNFQTLINFINKTKIIIKNWNDMKNFTTRSWTLTLIYNCILLYFCYVYFAEAQFHDERFEWFLCFILEGKKFCLCKIIGSVQFQATDLLKILNFTLKIKVDGVHISGFDDLHYFTIQWGIEIDGFFCWRGVGQDSSDER